MVRIASGRSTAKAPLPNENEELKFLLTLHRMDREYRRKKKKKKKLGAISGF